MGFCEDMVNRSFPGETTVMHAAAVSLDLLVEECGGIDKIDRPTAMQWVAASGLNIVTSSRKMRIFNAACEELGAPSVLDGVSYEDLDFSDDLERCFFRSYEDMMGYVSALVSKRKDYRGDRALITEALITLVWDGIPQKDIVLLNAENKPNPNGIRLLCGGTPYTISPQSFFVITELCNLRMEEGGKGTPLFASKIDGARWKVNNTNDVFVQLNLDSPEKKLLASKLKENGVFCRMVDYIRKNRCSVRDAAEAVVDKSDRKTANVVRAFYHWQKFYKIPLTK